MKLRNTFAYKERKDAVGPILNSTEHLSSMPNTDDFGTSTK